LRSTGDAPAIGRTSAGDAVVDLPSPRQRRTLIRAAVTVSVVALWTWYAASAQEVPRRDPATVANPQLVLPAQATLQNPQVPGTVGPGPNPLPPVTLGPIDGSKPGAPGPAPAPSQAPPRNLTVRPRSAIKGFFDSRPLENDETAYVWTGGIIVEVRNPGNKKGILDIEGDRLVVWTKNHPDATAQRLKTPEGETTNQIEFYIAGHVEMRYQGLKGETEVITADEVYYDVRRNVAIAIQGDLEIRDPKLPNPLHFKAPELHQLNAKVFETGTSEVYSTVLPSDPGLRVELRKTRLEERQTIRKNLFGQPVLDPKTAQPIVDVERYFTGRDMIVYLEGVPIFYWPYYTGNIEDPLGPLDAITFNYNRIFGFQVYTTWDIFDLLSMKRPAGTRWRLYLDYLSARGPAIGSEFDYTGYTLFGLPGKYDNITKIYGIMDHGNDIIGSGGQFAYVTPTEVVPIEHPRYRGRFFESFNAQDMPDGFSFQGMASLLSDRNYMEQFYQWEFLNGLNQSTFAYLKQQQNNWMWSLLVEDEQVPWMTRTEWLPRVDGYLLGETLFDRFVYNGHASAGYARLRVTDQPPFAFEPTDVNTNTGRLDLWQELSYPFTLGAFKVVPYLAGDLAYYSQDINGNSQGRFYGGAGLRASIPFSKLYPDVQSDLFNLNGIFHKMVLSGNFYDAGTNVPHTVLPQLDRLNDDVTDFTLRNMHVRSPTLIPPPNGLLLAYAPFYDPQAYAIRRQLDTAVDTLDSVELFQVDLRQRWQTKRGFPGSEHVVDWMTLDVSTTLFPDTHRDDFGHLVGFIDYDWTWNIGDRTALFSSGWFEPWQDGARVYGVGASFNRPDTTNFTIAYRQLDPVGSRAVIGSLTFPFSAKYALTASTTWDFGAHNQYYSLLLTRKGTDVLIGFGISYNSILNTFGVNFEIIPNLLLSRMRTVPGGMPGQNGTPLFGNTATPTSMGR
jgi:hypothetical protein